MKKGLILILGIIAVALKGEAQNNEPKIVKIEIVGYPYNLSELQVYPDQGKGRRGGNVGLKSFGILQGMRELDGTFWFTSFYKDYIALGPHYEAGKNILTPNYIDLGKKFSMMSRWQAKWHDFLLTGNTLQLIIPPDQEPVQQYTFASTPLNEFVLILTFDNKTRTFSIHKIIPYDGKEYTRYRMFADLLLAGDFHLIKELGGLKLKPYAAYLFGFGLYATPEKRREFEQKVRSASKLSQEELDKWLLDSEEG